MFNPEFLTDNRFLCCRLYENLQPSKCIIQISKSRAGGEQAFPKLTDHGAFSVRKFGQISVSKDSLLGMLTLGQSCKKPWEVHFDPSNSSRPNHAVLCLAPRNAKSSCPPILTWPLPVHLPLSWLGLRNPIGFCFRQPSFQALCFPVRIGRYTDQALDQESLACSQCSQFLDSVLVRRDTDC